MDEFTIKQFGADIKIEAGFYSRQLIKHLVNNAHDVALQYQVVLILERDKQ